MLQKLNIHIKKKKIKSIIIIILSILIILIILGYIIFNNSNRKIVLEDGKVTITNYEFKYDKEKKLHLIINLVNSSNKDIDLSDYNINLLTKDNKIVNVLSGNALGIVNAKDKLVSSISFDNDISNVKKIKVIKKQNS